MGRAAREPGNFQRQRRHKQHDLAFEHGILMRNKMINICIHGFSFHLLVLYTQGTFSSWYKVLRQVGETNI